VMFGAMGLTCATCGAVTAYLANRVPKYIAALQLIAGYSTQRLCADRLEFAAS
jgi:hypothetical protein